MKKTLRISLPKWYDLHVHLRQGELLKHIILDHIQAKCYGIVAMPNTYPPITKVLGKNTKNSWSIESYIQTIKKNANNNLKTIIVPLYLSQITTPEMIQMGAKSGFLKVCKYYPPFSTTNIKKNPNLLFFMKNGVFAEMESNNIILSIHGEDNNILNTQYFDKKHNAESIFYTSIAPKIVEKYPNLKIIAEHISTKEAVNFILESGINTSATITPQHLLYTVSDLLKNFQIHLYCLPILKFKEDQDALLDAITKNDNSSFFAGSDSAPHILKFTECGCSAGCYTAPIVPQLYIQSFENFGIDMRIYENQKIFQKFLCENGPKFYGLPLAKENFQLEKKEEKIFIRKTKIGNLVPLPIAINSKKNKISTKLPWSIL